MAQKSKVNGQSKKALNGILDSFDISNSLNQMNFRTKKGQNRNQQLVNNLRYDTEIQKASNINQLKILNEPHGRNLVNRSLHYDSHNNSLHHNGVGLAQTIIPTQSIDYQQTYLNQSINLGYNGKQADLLKQYQTIQQQQNPSQHKNLSQPPQQRNMVINLSQIKSLNQQTLQKQQYAKALISNVNTQQMANQAYTIDYIKSTKASHYSKKSSISKNPKESTKRSGTTGGTESNNITLSNSSVQPKQPILIYREVRSPMESKSSSKKSGGRNIVAQSHNGVSLRRIEKLRASSQLGQMASNNVTIDFDSFASREGAQSTLDHIQNTTIQIADQRLDSRNGKGLFKTTNISTIDQPEFNPEQINNQTLVFNDFKKERSAGKISQKPQPQTQYLLIQQNISLEIENSLLLKEKEIEKMSDPIKKQAAKQEAYMQALEDLANKDKGFSSLIMKIKTNFTQILKDSKQQSDVQSKKTVEDKTQLTQLQQQLTGQERVMKEMKKQIVCYKQEIQGIKKMESYLTLENYQKLINEFNTLYDHYKGLKQINKKIKVELKQSNQREKTFLKLLKKTQEYGDQAARLEQEYEKLYKEDEQLGLNVENLIVDSTEKRVPEMIEKSGIKIPKLDLSSIFIQREAPPNDEDDSGDQSDEESEFVEQQESDNEENQKLKQDKFEQEKKMFKMKMMNGGGGANK